jgi:prevent-host-death family protein
MTNFGVHEAKTSLSELLRRAADGEDIVITRGGNAVARLVPVSPPGGTRIGSFAGQFEIPADFDETPKELEEYFS